MFLLPQRRSGPLVVGAENSAPARRGGPWRPRFAALVISFTFFLAIGIWTWLEAAPTGPLDRYLAVFWTLPTLTTVLGLAGAIRARRQVRKHEEVGVVASELLVVLIPTVGRLDTLPALERVLRITTESLPAYFPQFRVDVVIEEGCAGRRAIEDLAAGLENTHVLVVPAAFQTLNRTHFKARANQYANLIRAADGEGRDDVWVLHMDDDTDLRVDTAAELAQFVTAQKASGRNQLDLAQGILCYPRELAVNRLVWLADAVRPGCDISIFSATTGSGMPRAGLHGEMLLVRASIEAVIGWDFGPRTIVEDAQFALHFCARYPGRSGWITARSYGASPASTGDFVRQRERWVWGLLELVTGRSQRYARNRFGATQPTHPSRWQGLLMLHNTLVWACAPLGHPLFVVALCLLLRDLNTSAPVLGLVPLWSINAAYGIWLYWEGLKLNADASDTNRRIWWEPILLLALSPLFTLWEVVGIVRGIIRFLRGAEPRFTVIAKPA